MGLTKQSSGMGVLKEMIEVKKEKDSDFVIALAGNPNTGKSTVFNSLTGMNQHTGNWPGKTVTNAQGRYAHRDNGFLLVDLPGTYSLLANSIEEQVARDFICFAKPDATVVVTDATCLERNLNLVLQIIEITDKVIVCVNLMDEARKKKIKIDTKKLSQMLGVPVVATSASTGEGLLELKDIVLKVAKGELIANLVKISYDKILEESISMIEDDIEELVLDKLNAKWIAMRLLDDDKSIIDSMQKYIHLDINEHEEIKSKLQEAKKRLTENKIESENIKDIIVSNIVKLAEDIGKKAVVFEKEDYNKLDRKIDRILTSKLFGIPIMLALLGMIFWITITGANVPSAMIADGLFFIEDRLTELCIAHNVPSWIHGAFILGMYRTLAWVVSVMLPPMAIFFPLFTLLEDLGYLPRVAFNLDNYFKKACACGKQSLTMCMGFGCNAAGIIGCRIIDSPRERLIAIITNFFVPCNGRFPTLIAIATIFIAGAAAPSYQSIVATLAITGVIVLGVIATLIVSRILSKTILKGIPSSFTLELPPYRKPQIGRIIVRSILDRTIFVLGRAVVIAAPAGLITWIMANVSVSGISLLMHCVNFLGPFANLLGMDGVILMAFILGLPANEIVMPIILMSYMATGAMIELDSIEALREVLVSNGWTWLTAINVMLFCLMHFPCGTTLLTIKKETQSLKWTAVAFLVPTIAGLLVCFTFTTIVRLLGLA